LKQRATGEKEVGIYFLLLSAASARPKKSFPPWVRENTIPIENRRTELTEKKRLASIFSFSLRPLRDQKNFFSLRRGNTIPIENLRTELKEKKRLASIFPFSLRPLRDQKKSYTNMWKQAMQIT